MSRLIVKNLPPYATPETLRKHFGQSAGPGGTITDVKVSQKQDGTSRRFGFVGFKSEAEASAAKEWFNKTFIDSTRIFVEIVEGAKDAPAPRPNKRPRLGPAPHDNAGSASKQKKAKKSKEEPSQKHDSQLDQYLQVMQPRNYSGPAWANDAKPLTSALKKDDKALEQSEDQQVNTEALSDLEWMKRHISKNVDQAEKAFHQDEDEEMEDAAKDEPQEAVEEPSNETKDTILQTSRLFVRNLAFSCTDAELSELFSAFGEISQVHIPVDKVSKQSKGVAYVKFAKPSCAVAAYEALDKTSFQGRLLHILPAVDRNSQSSVEDGAKKTLKQTREAKRKAMAGKEFNWSMLYMNSDAVVTSIAERMNIPKSEILAPESDNAAVKLALAETHIIQETRSYLESEGVDLSSFSSSKGRSDTAILVKNIPYGTSIDSIRDMFQPYGELKRVLLPPAGTIAVVEFRHAADATQAFRTVAYRRLGNSVIYLEKGPKDMFTAEDSSREPKAAPGTMTHAIKIAEQEQEGEGDEEPSLAAGTTLFVKNLSFATTVDKLRQTFGGLENFAFARVQTKPDPKRPGARLSMGYGFVGFKDADSARKAMKGMQGFVLDGHALHVKFAGRGAEEDETKAGATSSSKNKTTTKMIVKNVPFEATKKDIRQLFGSHGQLKSVRLPKKFDSRTRGFAFLEFTTRREAENAFATLRHTHLLGRHLVLEWAQDTEQDLEELRRKAGVGYGDGKALPGQKTKINMGGEKDMGDTGEEYD